VSFQVVSSTNLRLAAALALATSAAACGSDITRTPSSGAGGEDAASSSVGSGGSGTGGEDDPFEPAPGGMRRLLPQHVVRSISVVLGPAAAAAIEDVPPVPQLNGFAAIGAAELALSPTDVAQLETVATVAADAAVADRAALAQLAPCLAEAEPAASCHAEVAERVGRVAWRRPLDADERDRLVAIAQAGSAWAARNDVADRFGTGLKYELMALLQSPNFLYLVEVGEPDPEDATRRLLTPGERASRISFFLLGQTPDVPLLDAADAGELDTDAGVRAVASALLGRAEAREALDAFYTEFLFLDDLANVSKDPEMFPDFDRELTTSMRAETLAFLRDLIWERNADVHEMFTATETYVDPALATLYGVEAPGEGLTRTSLPTEQQRSGILGHASFLARFAHPGLTSPTRRGNLISTRFLCEEVPPPPPGVNPSLPDDPEEGPETMREKLTRHQEDPTCAACHLYMDPMGLALEHFDAVGAWRADDRGMPLDTSGDVENLGAFSGPAELGQRLAEDERTGRCVVKNFLRSSLGHVETDGERWEVRRISDQFATDGSQVQELLVELCASPMFRYVGEPK
jgi:hypothetical protein